MDSINFPVIISSSLPSPSKMVIAALTTEDKTEIVNQLEEQCTIRGIATELAIQAGEGKKKVEIPPQYAKFKRLFSEEVSHQFPPKRTWDHAIEFKADAPNIIDCKVYPMTQTEDKALEDFIKEQHAKGYIRPSKSPYASPFFFIKKRDGKLQLVQDYQHINNFTIRNHPSFLNSQPTSVEPTSFRNSTSAGDITMYASKRVMNTKQPLRPNMGCGNQQ